MSSFENPLIAGEPENIDDICCRLRIYENTKFLLNFDLKEDTSVYNLRKMLSIKLKKDINRICLYKCEENKPDEKIRLRDILFVANGYHFDENPDAYIIFKDLGPQINYRLTYYLEYFFPILIWLIILVLPSEFLYGKTFNVHKPNLQQTVCSILFLFHFVKRLLETKFIHDFSRPTMPLLYCFRNVIYYSSFSCLIAFHILKPFPSSNHLRPRVIGLIPCWIVCEVFNGYTHFVLKKHRKSSPKRHANDGTLLKNIPLHWLFKIVVCPNYLFEFLSWCFFTVISQSVPCVFFTIFGFLQMSQWSYQKKRTYLQHLEKSSDQKKIAHVEKIRKKACIIPFIL
eukprot:TRINITY_DN3012_c0_g2_i1.p1 TRINITY_DN3012_c0_g2~~TRINITY_DN3012_c0_g2_i1.p1  ORF type:complete len:352 (+),score=73.31 TRINITY_DN3012_c0_g2_i1:31-1056(+)